MKYYIMVWLAGQLAADIGPFDYGLTACQNRAYPIYLKFVDKPPVGFTPSDVRVYCVYRDTTMKSKKLKKLKVRARAEYKLVK